MKIILSRKGFDSSYGGYPSPILPDGRMLSLPIPGRDEDYTYEMLRADPDHSVADYMRMLFGNIKGYGLPEETSCHLDPDLNSNTIDRKPGWRGLFGQAGRSQSHLSRHFIGAGDIFLFFGWFKKVNVFNEKLRYEPGPGVHAIYGYLEVGEVINPRLIVPEWATYHSHTHIDRYRGMNMIYAARKRASWNESLSGCGTFYYDPSLVLTKDGMSRSRWELPEFFRGLKITHHSEKSWHDNYFQSAKRGQEFIIEEEKRVTQWAKTLIEQNEIWST